MIRMVTIIGLIGVLGAWITAAADTSDYHYVSEIHISNTSTSDVTLRPVVTIPAKGMYNNGYIQADADDLHLTYSTVEQEIMAYGLEVTDTAKWTMQPITVPAKQTIVETLWFGHPTLMRDQWWIASNTDSGNVSYNASLDMVNTGTISLNLFVSGTPSANETILRKAGNYRLILTPTPAVSFRVGKRVYPSFSLGLFVEGNGYQTNLTPVGDTRNYQCVMVNDGDTTYVTNTATGTKWDFYKLIDPNPDLEGSVITSVRVGGYARDLSPTYPGTATFALYLNGNTSYGPPHTLTNTYTLYQDTLSRPGGGTWSWYDLQDLQVGVGLTGMGSLHNSRCTFLMVFVDLYEFVEHSITAPISTGTRSHVTASYDGSALKLVINGNVSSTSLSGTLNAGNYDLQTLMFGGMVNDLVVQSDGATVMSLDFEPEHISPSTIIDQSGHSNDVTYVLASNPSTITVSLQHAESTMEVGIGSITDVPVSGVMPVISTQIDNMTDDIGSSNPFYPLVSSLSHASGIPIWIMWMLLYLCTVLVVIVTISRYVPHLGLIGVGVTFISLVFYVWGGLIPWWLLMLTILGSISTLIIERKGQI